MNKMLFSLTIALAAAFFVAGSASATTARFDVTEDTFINEAYPDNNYGSAGSIVVSSEPIDRYGFVEFENVSLPSGAEVDSVNFVFYVYDNSGDSSGWVRIGLIGGNEWDEDDPEWGGTYPAPLMSAGNFVDVNLNFSSGRKEVDVTDLVEKWLEGDKDQRGLYVYPNGGDFAFSFRSKEHGSDAAFLEVEYQVEAEEEYEFDLVSPEDNDIVALARPTFEWTEIDEDSDVDDYLLIINKIIDDGDDVEEVVDEKISEDETEYKIEEDLEEGEYRWYMAALRDDESSIHRTESWEFTVKFAADEEDVVEEESFEDNADAISGTDYISTLASEDETTLANQDGEATENESEEKETSALDNFLYLLLGIGLAIAAVLGYQEYMERKKKKENYKGLEIDNKAKKKQHKK